MGLGQSHLSQKIPATTTRCVYLDHLLSRAVNFGDFTTGLRFEQGLASRLLFLDTTPEEIEGAVGALFLQIPPFHRKDTAGMGRRERGTGSIYQRKDSGWVAQYRGSYRYAKTEQKAKRKLRQQADDVKPSNITVGTALDEYLLSARQNLKPRTITSYEHVIEAHLKPTLGRQKLHQLTAIDVERLYADKLQTLSASTVQVIHAVLSSCIKCSVRLRLVETNVCRNVERTRIQRNEVEVFDPAEVATILSATKYDRLEAFWVIALTGGLRQGEITGLQVRDYDAAKGKLAVRRTVHNNTDELRLFSPYREGHDENNLVER